MNTKITLILMTVLFSQITFGFSSVGKHLSRQKKSLSSPYRGSGIFWRKNNNIYYVTSSHAVFHAINRTDFRHEIFDRKGTRHSAIIESIHIGYGLAALKLTSKKKLNGINPIDYDSHKKKLADYELSLGQEVAISGYAFEEFPPGNLAVSSGSLEVTQSTRTFLPMVPHVFEFSTKTEYGNSGGGLFSPDGLFLGIVTAEYLVKSSEGKIPEISETSGNFRGIAIPFATVIRWLDSVFDDSGNTLFWDLEFQFENRRALRAGGILIYEDKCISSEKPRVKEGNGDISGNGAGISGNGAGISGNGAGISGNKSDKSKFRVGCRVFIKVDNSSKGQKNWPFKSNKTFNRAANSVKSGAVVLEVSSITDPTGREKDVQSLQQVLRAFHLNWELTLRGLELPGQLEEEFGDRLKEIKADLKSLIGGFGEAQSELLTSIKGIEANLPGNYHLSISKLNNIVNFNDETQISKYWEHLIEKDSDKGVELLETLTRLQEIINEIEGVSK